MSIIQKFKNDYNQTCHPSMLEALAASSTLQYAGYGLDTISEKVTKMLQEQCHCPEAQIHFLAGGTLTNLLVISAFLRPHQAVIAAESGHINIHETGAIEATGHKVLTCSSANGKLLPKDIRKICAEHNNEHMVQPKLVYISQATELGTIYSHEELKEISTTCKELNLYLFVDGARLGVALAKAENNPPSLADMAKLCDAFYLGGTKNGALFGEALVLCNLHVQNDFRYLCKQRGAMLAKGWLVAAQFEALLANNRYLEFAEHANSVAAYLDAQLVKMKIPLLIPTCTNQIFPILPTHVVEKLALSHAFEIWAQEEASCTIRFVTSWGTSMQEADTLLAALQAAICES